MSGILWTGVGIVDAVLNDKKRLAQEMGCRLDINAQLPVNTGIAEDDFCTVLSNLIDNAIESVDRERSQSEDTEPVTIDISLRCIHHFVMICIANLCEREPEEETGVLLHCKVGQSASWMGIEACTAGGAKI